ncbi:MAG: hypothetical protein ACFFDB_00265 [Promethearchaeota archaeon]
MPKVIIDFKEHKETNAFFILLFLIICSIVFFYSLANPLLKFIYLGSIVILVLYAFDESFIKFQEKKEISSVKETAPGLNKIRIKVNITYFSWITGIIFVIFTLTMLFIYQEAAANNTVSQRIQLITPIMLIISLFLLVAGKFGMIENKGEDKRIYRKYRIIEILGFSVSTFFIFQYILSFFYDRNVLIMVIFYSGMIAGLGLLLIAESQGKDNKARFFLILTLFIVIFLLIYDLFINTEDLSFLFRHYEYHNRYARGSLTLFGIIEIIESLFLMVFLLTAIFYILYRNTLLREDHKKERLIIEGIVRFSGIFMVLSVVLLFVFGVI